MNHLPFIPTPITNLPYFSAKLGCCISSKRDDLFLEAGGGSKARMLQYILADVSTNNYDVVLTAGGPCSNFNRACSLMCAKLGLKMHLVEYTDELSEWESLNYYLCRLAGIKKTRCDKTKVKQTLDEELLKYSEQGTKAFFVYGGGKSLQGIYAYYDAIHELKNQKAYVDHLFVACGTGTTLTGICAGMQEFYPGATVHAVSTARTYEQEHDVLTQNMEILNDYLKSNYTFDNLEFYDDYLCGGYAKYNDGILNVIRECIASEGMIIDPTYSGKAFYGMIDVLSKNTSKYNGTNVLFWNTGGIFNLLSTKGDALTCGL